MITSLERQCVTLGRITAVSASCSHLLWEGFFLWHHLCHTLKQYTTLCLAANRSVSGFRAVCGAGGYRDGHQGSEGAILRDLVELPKEVTKTLEVYDMLSDILETIHDINPLLRSIIRDQGHWDLDRLEE